MVMGDTLFDAALMWEIVVLGDDRPILIRSNSEKLTGASAPVFYWCTRKGALIWRWRSSTGSTNRKQISGAMEG